VNVLVLKPGQHHLGYACMPGVRLGPVVAGRIEDYRGHDTGVDGLARVRQQIRGSGRVGGPAGSMDAIAIRVTFGGSIFDGPRVVSADVLGRLEALVPHAPLHLPPVLGLIRRCHKVFAGVPIVLVFETAFFAGLPPREHLYGVDTNLTQSPGLRRYGFHGLFHEAACARVARDWRAARTIQSVRVLSVCLEPSPEVAAALGNRPMMVTGGATPLEGILGQTTCGQIDPSIVLALAREMAWGPEQINTVLTQQSGLRGLLGRPSTLEEVFNSGLDDAQRACDILRYRILQACGAGIATMGGVDTIVFSGRFVRVGDMLGPWLASRLVFKGRPPRRKIPWQCMTESLDRIIADAATAALLAGRRLPNAG